MKVYLFSYPKFFEGEANVVSVLMEQYDFTFHLRKPNGTENEYRSFLEALPEKFLNRIMLHNAYRLINEFDIKGLHYSAKARKEEAFVSDGMYRSTSCHTISEIEELKDFYNHMFISPIFPSISKKGYVGNLNLQTVSDFVRANSGLNIVALGGVDATRVSQVKEMGFQSLALLGSVWDSKYRDTKQVLTNYREIEKCLN